MVPATVLTAAAAWAGLLILSRFLWTKIAFSTEGSGWLLLPGFGACLLAVIGIRLWQGERVVRKGSCTWVVLFFAYFAGRLAVDSESVGDFVGYTLGYTNGVFFGYGLGVASCVLVDSAVAARSGRLRWIGAAAFLLFNILSAWQLESSATDAGLVDLYRAYIPNETYQVSGALISVVALLSAGVAFKGNLFCAPRRTRWIGACLVLMAVTLIALSARLAQLMGSNAGPAFLVPLAVIVCAIALSSFKRTQPSRLGRLPARWSYLSLWHRARAVIVVGVALALVMGCTFWIFVDAGVIDISRYRVFNFDEGSVVNSSVTSRLAILASNYSAHLDYAPVFGYFFVDRATTGGGTYAHSLLAIIPHLGVVGACIFLAMAIAVAKQLLGSWNRASQEGGDRPFVLLSMAIVGWAAIFLLLTNFFTSIVLWFPLGFFVPAVQLSRPRALPRRPLETTPSLVSDP